jgi:hypothetical protein
MLKVLPADPVRDVRDLSESNIVELGGCSMLA